MLLEPQALAGVGGTLLALVAVVRSARSGRGLALAAGSLVALGFAVVHGIPVASERTEPYWGDGSADALQWLGVLAIWACCAAVVVMAQRLGPITYPEVLSRVRGDEGSMH